MDFLHNADQEAILDAIGTIIDRHAGVDRLRAIGGDAPSYDMELEKLLVEAGFLDLVEDPAGPRLDAALVVEALSIGLASTAHAFRAMVAPSLGGLELNGPVALVTEGTTGSVRFAADAAHIIVVSDDAVGVLNPAPGSIERVKSRNALPVGSITDLGGATPLDGVDPAEVTKWWKAALAVEIVGAMRFAMDLTVDHVTNRMQFGRAIGSFQAVQHGLAECSIAVEGSRLLALEAAWTGSEFGVECALAQALEASKQVFGITHQYSGALGFTGEYDLHFATMRLPALRAEASGLARPSVELTKQHWGLA